MAFALITGASGGIGLALARELAARKHDLLLLARSEGNLQSHCKELHEKFGITADHLAIDLSVQDSALTVRDWLEKKNYGIDILINNAGFATWGNINVLQREDLNQMMRLNMLTLADLCKVLLPLLQVQSKAYILNVSSTAAYQAVPTMVSYAATKAFVLLFTRGLRRDLKETAVSVSCLSPGTTSSGFMDRANMGDELKKKAEKFEMTAEDVARIGVDGMLAGKAEIIPGWINKVSVRLVEMLPKSLTETIAGNIYKTR